MWPAFLSSKGVGVYEWCAVATTTTSCWYRVHSVEDRMFFYSNNVITHGEKAHKLYLLRRRCVHWNLSYVSYTVCLCITYTTEFGHRDFPYDYEDYYDWGSEVFEYKSKYSVLSYILTFRLKFLRSRIHSQIITLSKIPAFIPSGNVSAITDVQMF